jgi:LPXTG-motif cell wall-anchored protein
MLLASKVATGADDCRAAGHGEPGHIAPLGVWLGLQLGLLLVVVLQVPLSDQYARPAERVALEVVLIGQVFFAGLIFPWLVRSIGQAVMLAAASWPFVQLAMVLSSAHWAPALGAGVYLALWLAILGGLRSLLSTPRLQLVGSAMVTAFSAGGAILWYLRAEFVRSSSAAQWGVDGLFGPIMGITAVAHGEGGPAWLALIGLAAMVGLALLISWRWKRGQTCAS